jgi:hypothetical protein
VGSDNTDDRRGRQMYRVDEILGVPSLAVATPPAVAGPEHSA